MANHASAIKKYRQDQKRRLINRINLSKMKTKIKQLRKKVTAGQADEVKALYPQVISIIDMTIRKGTIHANTGSRYKSRISHLVNNAGMNV
jgi:small subunit ribosomal protein S20